MSEPMERGSAAEVWPLTDEGRELLERCLADVRREILERAQLDLYADGDLPRRLIGEHAIFNGFLDVAWEGFAVKPSEPVFQERWKGIGE